MGQSGAEKPQDLTARSLTIVDGEGRTRVRLCANSDDEPLMIFDEEGHTRVTLHTDRQDTRLTMFEPGGLGDRIMLDATTESGSAFLLGGNYRTTLMPGHAILTPCLASSRTT